MLVGDWLSLMKFRPRVEIESTLELGPAPLYDVRPALLARVKVFLRVIRWRAKNRHIVRMLALTPWPARIVRSAAG